MILMHNFMLYVLMIGLLLMTIMVSYALTEMAKPFTKK